MDGMHDLGGKQGFGKVNFDPKKPTYTASWEAKAHALNTLSRRLNLYNIDEYRHAVERMEPRHYLNSTYYERMLTGCVSMWVEKGLVSVDELERLAGGKFPLALPLGTGRVSSAERRRFSLGDRVTVKDEFVSGHHRVPNYVRGKTGVVIGLTPAYLFPDAAAHMLAAEPEHTYDVQFQTADLWPDASEQAIVTVGLFESYLQIS